MHSPHKDFHASAFGGHLGILRTYKRLNRLFEWTGLRKDVVQFIQACDSCQRNKTESRHPAGLLPPLPIPEQVWTEISMDFIMGLPRSNDKDTIMVVVDRLSKYAHFVALSHPCTAR